MTLRQVINALLPPGGLLDRLGDREKAQQKARETLVVLGGLAFRAPGQSTLSTSTRSGKGLEPPLAMFERFLRENGISSKVWKVREQVREPVSKEDDLGDLNHVEFRWRLTVNSRPRSHSQTIPHVSYSAISSATRGVLRGHRRPRS